MTRATKSLPAKPTTPRHGRRGLDAVVVTSAEKIRHQMSDLTGKLIIAAMQASPHRGIDIEPERKPMPTRRVIV
jgi:hypothetical protein